MEEEVKRQIELFTNMNSLPKIEMRVLITGSIRKNTLLELLPQEKQGELEKLFGKIDQEGPSLFSDLTSFALKDISSVKRVTKEVLEDCQRQNIIYLELRTFLLSQKDKYTKTEFLMAVLEQIVESNYARNQKMKTRLIISLDRKDDIKEYEEIYQIYKSINNPELKKLIVGIDFSGHENSQTKKYEEIIPIFKKFREEGLGITIHYGENPNYLTFPFDKFLPDRLSNCNFLKPEDITEVLNKNIPIEICPSLSYKITHSIDFSRIPLANFWGKKCKNQNGEEFEYKNVSINTDYKTLFLTDISQELHEIAVSYKLGIKELKDIIYNSINFIFEKDENVQKELREKLNNYTC